MIPTIIKILRLMLQHQVELSNKIDDLQYKNLPMPSGFVVSNQTDTIDKIVADIELLEDTLNNSSQF